MPPTRGISCLSLVLYGIRAEEGRLEWGLNFTSLMPWRPLVSLMSWVILTQSAELFCQPGSRVDGWTVGDTRWRSEQTSSLPRLVLLVVVVVVGQVNTLLPTQPRYRRQQQARKRMRQVGIAFNFLSQDPRYFQLIKNTSRTLQLLMRFLPDEALLMINLFLVTRIIDKIGLIVSDV